MLTQTNSVLNNDLFVHKGLESKKNVVPIKRTYNTIGEKIATKNCGTKQCWYKNSQVQVIALIAAALFTGLAIHFSTDLRINHQIKLHTPDNKDVKDICTLADGIASEFFRIELCSNMCGQDNGDFCKKGIYTSFNGDKMGGDLEDSPSPEMHTLADGSKEEGFFKDGKLNGKGVRILPSEFSTLTEEGIFKNGLLHGEGVRKSSCTYASETKEEGMFKEGQLHGEGVKIYANGTKEKGMFAEGRLHGKGVRRYAQGDNKDEGVFEYSQLKEGVRINVGTQEEGMFVEGQLLHGKGVRTSFFLKEEGMFEYGHLHGEGVRKYSRPDTRSSTSQEKGVFENGQLKEGVETCADGTKKEGVFERGYLKKGVEIRADGTKKEGVFETGRLRKGEETYADGTKKRYL